METVLEQHVSALILRNELKHCWATSVINQSKRPLFKTQGRAHSLRSSLSPLGFKKTEKQCLQQNRSGSEDKFWAPDRPAQSGHLFFFLLLGLKKPDRYQIAFEGALCLYRFNIVAIERRLGFGTIWEREFIRRKYNLARVI